VLSLLAAGQANLEIAAALAVSVHTIERHVANIFGKLGVRNRAEATAWAHRHGLAG
jgi:DNA-binding NarL/FixJ family response regulator